MPKVAVVSMIESFANTPPIYKIINFLIILPYNSMKICKKTAQHFMLGIRFIPNRSFRAKEYTSYLSNYVNDLKQSREVIEYQAYHDPLTGLFNRRYFQEKLNTILQESKKTQGTIAVLFIVHNTEIPEAK